MVWITNTEIGLDLNNSVIKRLWCTYLVLNQLKNACQLMIVSFYAPNFEEVEEAYWFGPVPPCVCLCIHRSHFAYGQERLEIGS